eukprot:INCI9897.5.p1 GENE.INCI9897.5~~INCI9897.5.p1  ORF type:complete len:427 (-),score=47.35 INCI9897.5:880-2160(-)
MQTTVHFLRTCNENLRVTSLSPNIVADSPKSAKADEWSSCKDSLTGEDHRTDRFKCLSSSLTLHPRWMPWQVLRAPPMRTGGGEGSIGQLECKPCQDNFDWQSVPRAGHHSTFAYALVWCRKGVADIGTFYASDSDAVDHVFFSKHTMRVLQVRQPVDLAAKRLFGRFPNSQFGSDHFPVAAVFQLKPFSYPVWSRAFDATTRRLHSQHSMEMNYDSDDSSVSSASSASTEILCQRTAARCSQARLPAGAFGHAAASSQHQWMGAETSMPWQQLDSRAQTRISGWGSAPRMIRHVSAPVTVGASQEPEQSARSAKKKKPKRTKQRNSATAGNRVEVLRAQQQATVGGRGAAKDIFGGRPPLLRARSAGIPAASRAVPGSDTETVKHHRRLLHTRLFGSGGRPMGRPRSNSGLDLNLGFLLRARRNS